MHKKEIAPKIALKQPGEIVTVRIMNPKEDKKSTGKGRPAALLQQVGGQWWTMGLTTKDTYQNGEPRTPIPDFKKVGLDEPGFLWGRPTRVSSLDIDWHVGWIDSQLVEAIESIANLDPQVIESLRAIARAVH